MGRMGRCRAVPREPAPWSPASTKTTLGTVQYVQVPSGSVAGGAQVGAQHCRMHLPVDEMKQRLSQVKFIHTSNVEWKPAEIAHPR
ncbi:unnamed protein product [Fusarium graminearum]|uniref:Chromosome 2, complete genome n=1 Tax=Gibberella zeae (strain ATCC MYA-4620 / CBS 123657 / FGSC 9075 / NRRL 31084 / PH-1) TaxID=229533 RepID=A0A098DG11_GIBZE|nr:unnamed protein product [Fusarium graminearum]CZS80694.1 unnamed protein product [Fusarium graminearum]